MLSFSKIKVSTIYFIFFFIAVFTLLNFEKFKNDKLENQINLGLDLQGGSYLLLEIKTDPLFKEKIQQKILPFKKFLRNLNLEYSQFVVNDKNFSFYIPKDSIEKFELNFFSKKNTNLINPYIEQYNSFELDANIENEKILISFSKFGELSLNNSAIKQSIEIIRKRVDEIGTKEPTIVQRGNKRILVELPGIKDPERIKEILGKTAQLTFRLVSDSDTEFGFDKMISEIGDEINVSKRIVISGDNLIDAQPRIDSNSNQPTVFFSLDRIGSQKFGRTTTENVGKRIAIVLDDNVISAPTVQEPITGGNGNISGNFSFQEATDLALLLRSGALPTELSIVEERTIGPDLGADSIQSGTISLIVGFILVILYMIFKYRTFGLVANISLIANLFMLTGILTILEVTLTLPGIAGIILTVGMAVDANVLIFERIREELKTEKSIIHAFDSGFRKAKITVLDANITTLIAASLLFFFGSGPVKGFAVTLGIGILTTLYSAYFISRHLSSILVRRDNPFILK